VCRLAAQDEARHVAFGMAHLREHISQDPGVLPKLANAVRRRHDVLRHTAGLNSEVFDALSLIASGGWVPSDLRRGHQNVMGLLQEMDELRQKRMVTSDSTPRRRRSFPPSTRGILCDGFLKIPRVTFGCLTRPAKRQTLLIIGPVPAMSYRTRF
jgi:hypothetical protein